MTKETSAKADRERFLVSGSCRYRYRYRYRIRYRYRYRYRFRIRFWVIDRWREG